MTKLSFDEPSSIIIFSDAPALSVSNLGPSDKDGPGFHSPGIGLSGSGANQGIGVKGDSEAGAGVHGESAGGRGVTGHSVELDGVQGISENGTGVFGEGAQNGVHGKSGSGRAVYGENTGKGDGVGGFSVDGTGTAGVSSTGNGVYGRSDTGQAGWFDGNVYATGTIMATDFVFSGRDIAERFYTVIDDIEIDPGSVVIFKENQLVEPCSKEYDRRVAGIVAGAGSLHPGVVLGFSDPINQSVPVSLFGTAFCKVDANYSPIEVGDLLTSSPTSGHAMAARSTNRVLGTIVGKALKAQTSGLGLIPVLVTLH